MGRLNNGEFLTQVGDLLTKNNGESSVYLTQKRLRLEVEDTKNDLSSNVIDTPGSDQNSQNYPILIRIAMNTNGKKQKTKLSTVVETDQIDKFWGEYTLVLKAGFVGLKKKDKKKKKRSKH